MCVSVRGRNRGASLEPGGGVVPALDAAGLCGEVDHQLLHSVSMTSSRLSPPASSHRTTGRVRRRSSSSDICDVRCLSTNHLEETKHKATRLGVRQKPSQDDRTANTQRSFRYLTTTVLFFESLLTFQKAPSKFPVHRSCAALSQMD